MTDDEFPEFANSPHRLIVRIELDEDELVVAGTEFLSMDQLEQRIAEITDRIITSIKCKRDGSLKIAGPVEDSDTHFVVDNECIENYEDEDA